MTGELSQRGRLLDDYGPVMHLNPSPPLEAAEGGIDALPGARRLMREFLLAKAGLDRAVAASGLAEQHLSHPAG